MIAVDATGSDSRPVALNSRRFRAAPTARQVAAAQGRAACPPTFAHTRVGPHGSCVRMPTIATYCIYSTKRTYHPASAGGRHSTGSRRRDYFSGVILFCAPRRTESLLRSARADAFPARCGSWQVHSISPPVRRRPTRRSIRREPQHVSFASARALPRSDFVLCGVKHKIAPWKCSRRREPDLLYFMAGRCCSARRGRAVTLGDVGLPRAAARQVRVGASTSIERFCSLHY